MNNLDTEREWRIEDLRPFCAVDETRWWALEPFALDAGGADWTVATDCRVLVAARGYVRWRREGADLYAINAGALRTITGFIRRASEAGRYRALPPLPPVQYDPWPGCDYDREMDIEEGCYCATARMQGVMIDGQAGNLALLTKLRNCLRGLEVRGVSNDWTQKRGGLIHLRFAGGVGVLMPLREESCPVVMEVPA